MLNPIDTDKVIRDHGATGRFPSEIHEGVAWWLGSCLVAVTEAQRLYVACDDGPATAEWFRRFCRGAVNCRHYACHVLTLAGADEDELLAAMNGQGPGAYLMTTPGPTGTQVVIRLYDEHARPLAEDTGLAAIRSMIAQDQVPIPVNAAGRGRVEDYRRLIGGTQ